MNHTDKLIAATYLVKRAAVTPKLFGSFGSTAAPQRFTPSKGWLNAFADNMRTEATRYLADDPAWSKTLMSKLRQPQGSIADMMRREMMRTFPVGIKTASAADKLIAATSLVKRAASFRSSNAQFPEGTPDVPQLSAATSTSVDPLRAVDPKSNGRDLRQILQNIRLGDTGLMKLLYPDKTMHISFTGK